MPQVWLLLVLLCGLPRAAAAQTPVAQETVVAVQVHGNVLTPSDEIVRLAGLEAGAPFDAAMLERTSERLRADRRFVRVDVRKRYASIADPSQVIVVIIVDEGPVTIESSDDPGAPARVVRARGWQLLYLPILRWDEGYGVAYGVRVARPDAFGPQTRITVPLSWGAERRLGLQAERTFEGRAVRRVEADVSIARRQHPFYRVSDVRHRIGIRLETPAARHVRGDLTSAWEQVRFGGGTDRLMRLGGGATLDTRTDPWLARNAVFARAAVERLWSRERGAIATTVVDVRGYLGLRGSPVLVVRLFRDGASAARPPFEQRMLGGYDVLRGVRFGRLVGDTLSAGSLELRTPVTSPLSIARLGVSVFVDAAAVYDVHERMRDQKFERGIGAGVWISAAVVRIQLAVARGLGRSTRFHLATSLLF